MATLTTDIKIRLADKVGPIFTTAFASINGSPERPCTVKYEWTRDVGYVLEIFWDDGGYFRQVSAHAIPLTVTHPT